VAAPTEWRPRGSDDMEIERHERQRGAARGGSAGGEGVSMSQVRK